MRRTALATALTAAGQRARLNQSELAPSSRLSRSAIVRLENDEASISRDKLWGQARALGATPRAVYAAAETD